MNDPPTASQPQLQSIPTTRLVILLFTYSFVRRAPLVAYMPTRSVASKVYTNWLILTVITFQLATTNSRALFTEGSVTPVA